MKTPEIGPIIFKKGGQQLIKNCSLYIGGGHVETIRPNGTPQEQLEDCWMNLVMEGASEKEMKEYIKARDEKKYES